jgi:hypothetical protein
MCTSIEIYHSHHYPALLVDGSSCQCQCYYIIYYDIWTGLYFFPLWHHYLILSMQLLAIFMSLLPTYSVMKMAWEET